MVNSDKLNEYINNSGIKKWKIAEMMGLTSKTLLRKIRGESDFKLSEADDLAIIVGIPEKLKMQIFFNKGG